MFKVYVVSCPRNCTFGTLVTYVAYVAQCTDCIKKCNSISGDVYYRMVVGYNTASGTRLWIVQNRCDEAILFKYICEGGVYVLITYYYPCWCLRALSWLV